MHTCQFVGDPGEVNTVDGADMSRLDAVDWSKDALVWSIDGNHVRTVKSSDFHVPELPMFMQMRSVASPWFPTKYRFAHYARHSIWPGGSAASPGTRDWAGQYICPELL